MLIELSEIFGNKLTPSGVLSLSVASFVLSTVLSLQFTELLYTLRFLQPQVTNLNGDFMA